jgi:hypothetical protein
MSLTELSFGGHNLTAYALDAAGNLGVSETVVFNVAKTETFPTSSVLAVSIAAVVVVAGLLIYHQRHKAKLSNRGTLAKVS